MRTEIYINKCKHYLFAMWPIGLLFCLTIVFFEKGVLFDRITLNWDAADYFYPMSAFGAFCIRNGSVPLWNPFIFCGYPHFADPQTQTFYPINIITALGFDFTPKVILLLVVFHIFLSGAFMYLLCRHFKRSTFASLIGGMAFMFSGYMLGHFQHVSIIYAVAWLPMCFLLLDKALEAMEYKWALGGSLSLAMCFLGGHPQIFYYTCLLLSIHGIYKTLYLKSTVREALQRGLICVVFFACAICLVMVQLLPTIEFLMLSNREQIRDLAKAGTGLKWIQFITIFIPDYFGGISSKDIFFKWNPGIDVSQHSLYMGVIPVISMGYAMLFSKDRFRWYLFGMAVFGLLISMGFNTPLFKILYKTVPGVAAFQGATHIRFIFIFFGALLAALGIDTLVKDHLNRQIRNHKDILPFLTYVILFMVCFLIIFALLPKGPEDVQKFYLPVSGLAIFAFIFTVSALGMLLILRYTGNQKQSVHLAMVLILFIDIFFLTSNAVTIGEKISPDQKISPSQTIRECASIAQYENLPEERIFEHNHQLDMLSKIKKNLFRIYVSLENRVFTPPADSMVLFGIGFNRPLLYGFFLVDGYSPMFLKRHFEASQYIGKSDIKRWMVLTNARYHIKIGNPNIITGKRHILKRAMYIPHAVFLNDKDAIFKELANPGFDPFEQVVIEDGKELHANTAYNHPIQKNESKIEFLSYKPNQIVLKAQIQQDGYLLFDQTWYPGWKAYVDGKETKVFKANYISQAIEIKKGDHSVAFVFNPVSFKIGALITSSILLFILVFLGLNLFVSFRKKNYDS